MFGDQARFGPTPWLMGGRSIAAGEAGFESLRGTPGTVGMYDGRAHCDSSRSRFNDAIEIVLIDPTNGEPGQPRRFTGETDEAQAG